MKFPLKIIREPGTYTVYRIEDAERNMMALTDDLTAHGILDAINEAMIDDEKKKRWLNMSWLTKVKGA